MVFTINNGGVPVNVPLNQSVEIITIRGII